MAITLSDQVELGFVLSGSYINIALLVLGFAMFRAYWRSNPAQHDNKWKIRYPTIALLFFDAVGSVSACAVVYVFVYSSWRDTTPVPYTGHMQWPSQLSLLSTACNAIIVQTFMTYRYWSISRHRVMTLILLLFTCATFALTINTVVLSLVWNRPDEGQRAIKFVITRLILSATTDILIMLCLLMKFWNLAPHTKETHSLLQRLSLLVIQIGLAPTLLVIVALISYCIVPRTLVTISFTMSLGSVYSLTMYYTLIRRQYLRSRESWIDSETLNIEPSPEPRDRIGMVFARPPRDRDPETTTVRSFDSDQRSSNTYLPRSLLLGRCATR